MVRKADPAEVYTIEPDHMQLGIDRFLTPVIDKLGAIRDGFSAAHGEVRAARDNEAPGWFGGEGNGHVKAATGFFVNEVAHQLELLIADQTALAASLADYRSVLEGHLTWARETDLRQADGFMAIQRGLDERGN